MWEGSGFEIAVVSSYGWAMEVQIVAANESFRGCIEVETNPDWLTGLAAKFRGYPKSHEDYFREEIGVETYRYVAIEAFCTDTAGHVVLAVYMTDRSPVALGSTPSQEARIVIPFEPSAADDFATALERIADTRTGRAQLAGFR